jgi:serine/threonine protein kinase
MPFEEKSNLAKTRSTGPELHLHTSREVRPVESENTLTSIDFNSTLELWADNPLQAEEVSAGSVVANQFEVIAKIGSGGMSHVYKCQDLLLNRIVAIKIMRIDLSQVPQAAARFQREAKVVALLQHENIVKLYGLHLTEQRQPFIVMELIEGESLSSIIEKLGALPLPRVIKFVSQICDALALAHANGVVHRDLKPSNIMITNPGRSDEKVKVLDFGIAKLASDTTVKATQTGEVFGSPAYMSPEQALGQPVDEKSDQYSLGCVIFEALTARTPFLGESFLPMMMAHVNDPAPSLAQVAKKKHFPAQIERTVAKLLEKKSCDRFASITDAKQAFLGNVQIKNQSNPYRALLSKRSLILAASITLAIVIAWGANCFFNQEKPVNRETEKHYQPGSDNGLHLGDVGTDDLHLMYILHNDPYVQAINLGKLPKVTDAGLEGLSHVRTVTRIDLSHCDQFTDAGVKHLAGLPLIILRVHDTSLNNAGMHSICQIRTLRKLDVCDNDIDDDGCSELANLSGLKNLEMHKVMVTGRTLYQIAKLKNLLGLDLGNDKVADNLSALQQLKLIQFYLPQTYLTDANLLTLSRMHSLTLLDISNNNRITDAGLVALSSLKNLRELRIVDCPGLTDVGVHKIKTALPHCYVREVGKSAALKREAVNFSK